MLAGSVSHLVAINKGILLSLHRKHFAFVILSPSTPHITTSFHIAAGKSSVVRALIDIKAPVDCQQRGSTVWPLSHHLGREQWEREGGEKAYMPKRLAWRLSPQSPSESLSARPAHLGLQKPLELAAEGGFVDTMRILINANASVNAMNSVPAPPASPACQPVKSGR